jgi:hypothetical protein
MGDWVGLTAGLDVMEKRRSSASAGNQTPVRRCPARILDLVPSELSRIQEPEGSRENSERKLVQND